MIVSALQVQRPQYAFKGLVVAAMISGRASAGAAQFRPHVIAVIGVKPLL
jgi:hypothetical protein